MSNALTDPPPVAAGSEERQWAMFAHLASLIAMWLGYLGFLGPLFVWLIKRNEMTFVDDQGKEALNFQLNMLVLGYAVVLLGVPITVLTLGLGAFLAVPLGIAVVGYSIVMSVIAGIKANAGEAYRYPYIIRVIK